MPASPDATIARHTDLGQDCAGRGNNVQRSAPSAHIPGCAVLRQSPRLPHTAAVWTHGKWHEVTVAGGEAGARLPCNQG